MARTAFDDPAAVVPVIHTVQPPGAAGDFAIIVPGEFVWEFLALRAKLTTDATAATRLVNLIFDNGQDVFWVTKAPFDHLASQVFGYNYGRLFGATIAPTVSGQEPSLPVPELDLLSGWRIRVATANRQAGDRWTEIVLLVRERFTGATEPAGPLPALVTGATAERALG